MINRFIYKHDLFNFDSVNSYRLTFISFVLLALRSDSQCLTPEIQRTIAPERDSLELESNQLANLSIVDRGHGKKSTTEYGEQLNGQSSQSFSNRKCFKKKKIHLIIFDFHVLFRRKSFAVHLV